MLAHRFLRLTPLYAFVLALYGYIVPHMWHGPLWDGVIDSCNRWYVCAL